MLGVLVITARVLDRDDPRVVDRRSASACRCSGAKAVVFALVTFVLMLPAVLIAFFIAPVDPLAVTTSTSPSPRRASPRASIGAALYLTVIGLFGLGLGAIVRNTAGGIATFAAIMFVLPPLMNVLPTSWNNAASPYLPLQAGRGDPASTSAGNQLAPWTGFGVLCALRRGCARDRRRAARAPRHVEA